MKSTTQSNHKLRIYFAVILLSFYYLQDSVATTPKKAIFIIVDGIPADLVELTPTPFLDIISENGVYKRAYTGGEIGGESESPTISAVGYMNLITGTWANKHNVWDNNVESPNYDYWDIFRIARTHNPKLKTALFSTWEDNRTKLVGDGLAKAGGSKLSYSFDGFEKDTKQFPHDAEHRYIAKIDDLVATEAARYIRSQGPDLSWVYLEHTDSVAHQYGDSPEFSQAITQADSRVGKIWQAIQDRQQSHHEDWLLIVTTDHGRDASTGKSHGGQSPRERSIWISMNSKIIDIQPATELAIVDILPSIANHLGLQIPAEISAQLDGKTFIGAP